MKREKYFVRGKNGIVSGDLNPGALSWRPVILWSYSVLTSQSSLGDIGLELRWSTITVFSLYFLYVSNASTLFFDKTKVSTLLTSSHPNKYRIFWIKVSTKSSAREISQGPAHPDPYGESVTKSNFLRT